MNPSTEALLEFDKLLSLVRRNLTCAPGERALDRLAPSREQQALAEAFTLFEEARTFLRESQRVGFSYVLDPAPLLEKLGLEGVTLEPHELLALGTLLRAAVEARESITRERGDWPGLAALAGSLADFRALKQEIERKILPNGEIDSNASPQLARIRQQIERTKAKIQRVLQEILRAHRQKETVQDEFVTIRGERFVIPVRVGEKRRVAGVIHGASASGATLFIEPLETIDLNNDLVRLMEEEAAEIRRILRELTAKFQAEATGLAAAAEVIGHLDLIFAKAQFAARFDATSPIFDEDAVLRLSGVRHPVLQEALRARGENIVPISVSLDPARHVMIISGPNTGGKTVALKTIGAAVLAAQTGIPVAAESAVVPLFDHVRVDLGDQQSIEENLSTFSAHMLNLRVMLERVTPSSLVLIDEMGTGTDPSEGAALAVAILERFRQARALTIATTHQQRLKAWAASTPGVLNAAVEFDEVSLRPTYRLITGVPGVSSGIEIARRLGLPSEVVEDARQSLAASDRETADLIRTLHESRDELDRLKQELRTEKQRLEDERRELQTQWLKTQKAKLAELERDFRALMAESEKRVRALLDEIKDRSLRVRIEKQVVRKVAALREEAREAADGAVLAHLGETQTQERPRPAMLSEGMTVKIRGITQSARFREKLDDKTIEVEIGRVRMRVPVEDVVEVVERPSAPPQPTRVKVHVAGRLEGKEEINVVGCTVDEALPRVDKFLDNAYLAELRQVRVIHGHGTGALRKALAAMLKEHPLVERFGSAEPDKGGAGVTVVELRS